MKAFMIFSGYPQDGCLLVFAETRNKAKYTAVGSLFDWEYSEMNSRRMPDFDQYYDGYSVIEDNSQLPEGAPDFYDETIRY